MGFIGNLIGSAAAADVTEAANGIGDAAIKIREALTGDIPPDKKAELEMKLAELDKAIKEDQMKTIVAEAQGQSWLQRNWRPLLMLTIIVIVANNYILYPYLSIITDKVQVLSLPSELWSLMQIGVGGYIVGRTVEKIKGAE